MPFLNKYPLWELKALGVILLAVLAFGFGSFHGSGSSNVEIASLEKQVKELNKESEIINKEKKLLMDSDRVLGAKLAEARDAADRSQAIVEISRKLVKVADPSHLEVKNSMVDTSTIVSIPSVVVAALQSERVLNDSLRVELDIKDEIIYNDSLEKNLAERQHLVDTATVSKQEEEVSILREAQQCKVLWVLPCPSRKAAAVIGGAIASTAIVVFKVAVSKRS